MGEVLKVREQRVHLLSPEEVAEHEGRRVSVHMHSPAMRELGEPIFSMLAGGKVVGQVRGSQGFGLSDAGVKVDPTEARKLLDPNHPGGKTRNTFITGILQGAQFGEQGTPLSVRPPGIVGLKDTGEEFINFPQTGATKVSMGGDVSVGMSETPSGLKVPNMIFHDRRGTR